MIASIDGNYPNVNHLGMDKQSMAELAEWNGYSKGLSSKRSMALHHTPM